MDDSVFPPAAPVSEEGNKAPMGHTISGANSFGDNGVVS
jgi:hypothetical protein